MSNHDQKGCCGNHDHETVEMEVLTIDLEDGSTLDCYVLEVFEVEGKEYIALMPTEGDEEDENDEILLYGYKESDNGIELLDIEDDATFDMVVRAFEELESEWDDEE